MPYLVMTAPAGRPSEGFATILADLQDQAGWRLALSAFGLAALVKGDNPPEITPLTRRFKTDGVVVGRIFDRQADPDGRPVRTEFSDLAELDAVEACSVISSACFGGYVAVIAPDRGEPAIFRGPSGVIDAFTWSVGPVSFVGDDIPIGLAAPDHLAIDWPGVAAILARPIHAVGRVPLQGVAGLDPGVCRHGAALGVETVLWSPARIARRGPIDATHDDLRAAVDLAIAAERDIGDRVLCEISGGLDSAIVATSLKASGHPPVAAVNFWRDQSEADERRYAEDAAEATGVDLSAVHRDLMRLSPEVFEISAMAVRPNVVAADPDNDGLLVEAIKAAGATVLMTGHGGDVVFLQVAASQIAADLLTGAPCVGSRLARLADIARRSRRSVWSMAWEAITGRPSKMAQAPAADERDFILAQPDKALHSWTSDVRGVSRARRVQIEGLVNSLGVVAHTRRGAVARIAHPLLSQPVVELCLRIPTPILSSGEGERTFARQAFADRLPRSILDRRSKGDVTTYFGRSMAANLDFLRAHLLDGRLVAQGLLDRARLEAVLHAGVLIRRHSYGDLLFAAGLEAWVRHWEGRVGSTPITAGGPIASARNDKARV
jgi:asparagine synthase (glutamine-hydrolysing)